MAGSQQRAYDTIRSGITSGSYPSGLHLRAADLADRIGISRTPVREALRRLHAEGLVEFVPNRGAFVSGLSETDVAEVFDLRVVLEGHAAELAAKRLTRDQRAELGAATDEMERCVERGRDLHGITHANDRFHSLIIAAAASRRLSATIASVVEMSLIARTFTIFTDAQLRRSVSHHRELITAFEARDGTWAAAIMSSHIRAAYNVYRSMSCTPDCGLAR